MKLIIEIRRHGDDEDVQHFVFTQFPVRLGRGFDNDVILHDAYVSPHHLQIDYDGETCTVSDNGSDNGFTVNDLPASGSRAPVKSGDTLHVGQTDILIYKPEHPVTAAIRLPKNHPLFAWIARPLNVWICFLLAMAFTLVYTGEHFVLDEVVGWSYAIVTFVVGGRLFDRWAGWREARREERQSAEHASAAVTRPVVLEPIEADSAVG